MTNEYVVAHAVCPVCVADVGEPCVDTYLDGVHAGRHAVLNLPTLADIAAAQRLRERFAPAAARAMRKVAS